MQSYTVHENHMPYADGHGTFPTDQYRTTELLLSVAVDTDTVSDHNIVSTATHTELE